MSVITLFETCTLFKFGNSSITPKFLVGQVADQALGALDDNHSGIGLSSSLVLDQATKLTLTPNVMYTRTEYDNWTDSVLPGSSNKRIDNDISGGIAASIQLAKNIGVGMGYTITKERSNLDDGSENYRQEIVSSTLTLSF